MQRDPDNQASEAAARLSHFAEDPSISRYHSDAIIVILGQRRRLMETIGTQNNEIRRLRDGLFSQENAARIAVALEAVLNGHTHNHILVDDAAKFFNVDADTIKTAARFCNVEIVGDELRGYDP